MKKIVGLICFSFLLINCKNSIKNENAEVIQEAGTVSQDTHTIITVPAEIISSDTTPDVKNLYGFWVGYFEKDVEEKEVDKVNLYVDEGYGWGRENKINISIDNIDGDRVDGHSVVAGNSRPFTGSIKTIPQGFSFQVREPGDHKYDGEFIFEIKGSALIGKWNAFKAIEIPKRKNYYL